ncbi:hypothetical protein [Bradyrhizobium valentinum]|uniref:hypothetical protein n=1 Tax=Bradyrhizobium valentinum TaxID=1518501 RepID=UPI000A7EBACF|nr:hypothetical protein [Bradyrhizobium valentinum]
MLRDGTYAAWFKTPLGQGTGIAHVAEDRIRGRDSIMIYSGTCEVDGDRFTAVVTIKRHTEGHATVFGTDDLTLKLEGACPGNGEKFYATGALFADYVPIAATDSYGKAHIAIAPRDADGLTIIDNWSSFGQRTTASGSVLVRTTAPRLE